MLHYPRRPPISHVTVNAEEKDNLCEAAWHGEIVNPSTYLPTYPPGRLIYLRYQSEVQSEPRLADAVPALKPDSLLDHSICSSSSLLFKNTDFIVIIQVR